MRSRAARQEADELADRLLGVGRRRARRPPRPPCAGSRARRCRRPFAVQLVQRLRDQDPAVDAGARAGSRSELAAQGTTAEEIVRDEHQRQAAMNVTVRNVITSMRLISWFDWAGVLREREPGRRGAARRTAPFAAMDFATRDRYRHAIEELARGSGRPELEIARTAVAMAERAADPDAPTSAGQGGVAIPATT